MSVWNLAKYVAKHQPEYVDFEIIEEVGTYNDKMYSVLYTEEKKTLFGRIKQEQVYLSINDTDSLITRRFFSIDEAKKKVREIIDEYKVRVPKTVLYCRQFVNDNDIAESVEDSKPENDTPQTEHKNDKENSSKYF